MYSTNLTYRENPFLLVIHLVINKYSFRIICGTSNFHYFWLNHFRKYMLEAIRDKQRILIAGSEGKEEVFEIVNKVLEKANKPHISFRSGDDESSITITDAPVVIILCAIEHLRNYEHHIVLLTAINEKENDFNEAVREYEKMLDRSPKAGCVIYNEEDSASALIGKKEREDVVRIEYQTPKTVAQNGQEMLEIDKAYLPKASLGNYQPAYIKGAYTLLKRIGIKESQFIEALS